jgi:predicted MFS family arabinose efflux permease
MSTRERRAVGALALLYSFRMLGLFMVLPLLALYAADIPGATPLMIGLALGAYGLTQALLQIPLSWLSDRVGRKPVIVAGLLLFAVGSLVAAMADSLPGIVFGRFLQGAGAIAGTVMALAADLTSEEQRTKGMAVIGASIGVSFALALVLGPMLASAGGLSAVFAVTAVLAISGIFVVWLIVPAPGQSQSQQQGVQRGQLLRALTDPAVVPAYVGVFSLHYILMASFLVVPGVFESVLALPREDHWQVYLPILALSVAGMLPLMRLAERNGYLRETLLGTIILVFVAVSGLVLLRAPMAYYIALLGFFIGFNYLEATLPSLVSKAAPATMKGTAMGVFSTCQFLGAFAGGIAGGWTLEVWGLTGLAVACLIPGIFWLLLALPRRPETSPVVEDARGV